MGHDWRSDILDCIDKIEHKYFTLYDIYQYEDILKLRHPQNNHIRPKIRQQLQVSRDNGYIEFLGNGNYKKK